MFTIGSRMLNVGKWSDDQILQLGENYTLPKSELQALFTDRSWDAITQKINKLGLTRKNNKWSDWEDQYLTTNYFLTSTTDIAHYLNRTIPSIIQRAIKLNLEKSKSIYRKTTCSKLLDGSLESIYWLGFIFADGHISKSNRLNITLSLKDLSHLEKFASYINSKVWISRFGRYDKCTVSVKDIDNIKILKQLYDIHHQKTYNPPNLNMFDSLSDKQKIAFIIGFIDGDGSLRKLNRTSTPFNIIIKNHATWLPMHTLFSLSLIDYFDVESNMKPKILNSGYSQLNITHSNIIGGLKDFVEDNNLPVLERKWESIYVTPRIRQKLSKRQIEEVQHKFNEGAKIYHLSKEYNVSFHVIKRLVELQASFE